MLRSHNSALELQTCKVFEQPGIEWSLTCANYAVSHSKSVTQKNEIVHKTPPTHTHTQWG